MSKLDQLIEVYGKHVNTDFKSPDQVLQYLIDTYDAEDITSDSKDVRLKMECFMINLVNHKSSADRISVDDIRCLGIKRSDSSEELYARLKKKANMIVVFLEMNSGYYYTNSSFLNYHLIEYIGVTEEDVKNRSDRYIGYITHRALFDEEFN